MNAPSRVVRRLLRAFVIASACAFTATLTAQIPSRNVNMVSGLEWPGGDPFLQRQNEPSVAASTRNPLHLLAGSNDYRSVDLAGILGNELEQGDAWAGLFTSTDGGERWTSTLVPGFPHDPDPRGQASPLYGYQAAADPVVRAGTNGLIYYSGLVFDRAAGGFGKSGIYVARFIDNNNQEAVHPFEYIDTTLVSAQTAGSGVFLDKPWMAVDIPRQGAGFCNITTVNEDGPFTQRLPAGNVYVAFTVKSTDSIGDRWDLYFSRSTDCGVHFSAPMRISRAQDRVNQGASIVISPPTGEVFISWRRIDLNATDNVEEHAIVVAKSMDQGRKFTNPGVARRFPRGKKKGLQPNKPGNGKTTSIQAASEFELSPLDQPTSDVDKQFRTNAYPTMAADGSGRLYLAWTERGFGIERSDPAEGDARIVVATSTDGVSWTPPNVVSDDAGQKGHQLMPAISFAGGRLVMIYYDLQEDNSKVFKKNIDDRSAILESNPVRRHTFDVRVAMAEPGASPTFLGSQSVSKYLRGTPPGSTSTPANLQVNPPNLPMFKLGTVPFIGDYIDLAPSPAFVPTPGGGWTYNTAATSTPPVFHAVWTDNRDVKPPYTRNWQDYTPPNYAGPRPDPTQPIQVCLSGLAGSRNQNIYTARITGGLVVGSPQNSKQLSTSLQRAFVVFAQNTTGDLQPRKFRMTILNQPPNGRASFSQYPLPPFTPLSTPPVTTIDMSIPRFTTASRTVYVTSSDPHAQVRVDVSEIPDVGSPTETPDGLEGLILLNPDVLNPEVDNPEVDNPEVDNPEVDNAEVYNPEVDNPEVDNPEVDNPEVDNPEVDNPEVDNIVVGNPEVDNPEVDNPEVDNPEVDNPEVDNPEVDNGALLTGGGVVTDITWTIKNIGNTTTAYDVNLFLRHTGVPSTGRAQLLVYRVYKTPMIKATQCDLKTVTQNVLIANIPDPALIPPGGEPSDPNDPARTNATLWIEPEKVVRVTLRVFDPDKSNNININGSSIDPEWVPEADVSLFAQSQPVNTPDAATTTEPPLVGADPITTFTVTSNADSGPGSLREAIQLADLMPGLNTIEFNLPGANPHTIAVNTILPSAEEAVIIDGSTQPGYAGAPVITIDGSAVVGLGSGIHLRGGGSTVRGLAIGGFGDNGVWLDNLGSNEVYGNYIGFDASGTTALPNGQSGVSVGTPNNIIGTMALADRNVIGNGLFWGVLIDSANNRVEGNYIGVDATGDVAAPQLMGVILSGAGATANVIGGNVISSSNLGDAVAVAGPANRIEKNFIGTNAAGTAALANVHGIRVVDAIDNRILDNLISGNSSSGIRIERVGADPTGTEITGNKIGINAAGNAAIANNMGIEIAGASNVTIGGIGAATNIISGNTVDGINVNKMNAAPNLPSSNVSIKGNWIGLNGAGNAALPNGFAGISITEGINNVIGSAVAAERNVISGNGGPGILIGGGTTDDNNVVIGNYIGTNLTGTAAINNAGPGITLGGAGSTAMNTRIGGINPGEMNVISGNTGPGISVQGGGVTGTSIRDNYIGPGADGSDLGNGGSGVLVNGADGTAVGSLGAGNLISGNGGYGVSVSAAPNTSITSNTVGVSSTGFSAMPNLAGGIFVTGAASTNWSITSNKVAGNSGFAGISIQDTPAGLVNRNSIGYNFNGTGALPNNQNGIDADNVGATQFTENVVGGNTGNGIYVVASNGAVVNANIVGLNFAGTAAIGNGANGIFVEFLSNGTIGGVNAFDRNTVVGNGAAGIKINSTANTNVRGNLVGSNNLGTALPNLIGIQISGATTTGTIGGDTVFTRNIFSGNTTFGVQVQDAGGVFIEGNFIGVTTAGIGTLGNGVGVQIEGGTAHLGDTPAGQYNVIGGNTLDGVRVVGGTAGNRIDANYIGTDPTEIFSVPNGRDGVRVEGGQPSLGQNHIANNAANGVTIIGVSGVPIFGTIFNNGGMPIDLGNDGPTANDAPPDADGGANNLQNYPSVSVAGGNAAGELFSAPNANFSIAVYYGDAAGNARTLLGTAPCATDPAGHCFWGPIAAALPSGTVLTATATDAAGNTSEMGWVFVVP